ELAVDMHVIGIHDALFRYDVVVSGVEGGDHAALPLAGKVLAAAHPEVEFTGLHVPLAAAAEPAALGLLVRESRIEERHRRIIVALQGEVRVIDLVLAHDLIPMLESFDSSDSSFSKHSLQPSP